MMRRFNQLASRGRRQPAPRALVGLLLLLWLTACQAVVPPTPVSGGVQPAPRPQPAATPAPQPLRLVLLHTNDTWGYLWPCG
ncbi:MAG: hypothetical protein IPO15_26585 [Anaerolineae bacterium]|uniref:hypothetical protein n=1 Tax=Candidatus Amarolinea dominans TaxID=3140696 RepID=UPI003134994D|nr:hypothetical protein [Anaerolineae bacterium]